MPLSSLKRAFKYVLKGYRLPDESLIGLGRAINERIDFEDEESVAEHTATIYHSRIDYGIHERSEEEEIEERARGGIGGPSSRDRYRVIISYNGIPPAS